MSLKSEIQALKDKIRSIGDKALEDPEFVKLSKKYHDMRSRLLTKSRQEQEPLYKEVDEKERQLRVQDESKEKSIPEKIVKFIQDLSAGVDYGPHGFKVRWYSEDCRFCILTNPGHLYWSGRGETSYGKTDHYLFDIDKANGIRGWNMKERCCVEECEGRLSKEKIEEWKKKAKELSEKS